MRERKKAALVDNTVAKKYGVGEVHEKKLNQS